MAMEKRDLPNRLTDRNDVKWAHPALVENYYINGRKTVEKFTNPAKPIETRLAKRNKMYNDIEASRPFIFEAAPELEEHGETTQYNVPGCPEEPETQVKVDVRSPKDRTDEKLPCVFYIAGGAFLLGTPWLGPVEEYSMNYNCVVVAPWYRTGVDAQYPAAVNDLHAAYQWMIDNAEMLGIDTDKVVITGMSAGAALSLSLGFRLKRYEYKPRGIVALDPISDERSNFLSHTYVNDGLDSGQISLMMKQYLGPEKVGSNALGPEALANRATVEECKGLAPVIIHVAENDVDRDPSMQFMSKLYAAGVYAEIHAWGGCCHATLFNAPKDNPVRQRFAKVVDGNITDFFEYDMRREWLNENTEEK